MARQEVISKVLFTHVKQDESRNWFKFLGKQAGTQAVISKGFPIFSLRDD